MLHLLYSQSMTEFPSPQKLLVLGSPRVQTSKGEISLERKTAAVLAYLALEGETSKYKLAGFLWPDSGETAARNNMRQLLRRLRLVAGELVEGDDRISLSQIVTTDVSNLSSLDLAKVLELKTQATLLEGLEYDDAPDFAEWLEHVREEFAALRLRAAETEADRLESKGQFNKALELAHLAVKLEPLSEESHRRVMRLHYLSGDRAAALAAFERCKETLQEELGAEPLEETLELARMIERGATLKGVPSKPKEAHLPTAILRPPVLAGREREWALMEEAWEAGKFIFLVGEPGVGKSRLATDFLASKGGFISLETRPGDAKIPYSSNNRFVRIMLARYPDYTPPAWVRQTLAPWMPEFGEGSPSSDPALHTRYFEAMGDVFDQIGLHGDAAFVDDLQFMDDISARTGEYVLSQLFPLHQPGGVQGFITCYRKGEVSPLTEQMHVEMSTSGMAVRIFLEPLSSEAVGTLLDGLGLRETEHLVPGLSRYTGGNPLFVLETVKHLIETDTLAVGLPSRLAPPGKVAALVTRRLQRLSPQALNLARSAAVAGTSFEMRLAAHVLERPAMELAEAHAELEATQILRGNAFTHDLVFEATLAGIPSAVLHVFHARTAHYLETINANPALIAHHWLEGGNEGRAATWLLEVAQKLYSGKEAANFYARAAEIFERHGEHDKALESRAAQSRALEDEATTNAPHS
jgi:DNA-binding SARP family transcriptional activator